MEEVERVKNFLDENAEDSLFGHFNLAFPEFHSLKVTQGFITNTTRISVRRAKDVVGELTVELNRDKFLQMWLPLKVDKAVCEETSKTFDRGVSFLCDFD